MRKRTGVIGIIAGVISSIIGAVGACMVLPICGGICLSGLLASILGVGIVTVLHDFGVWFSVIGGILFVFGVLIIIIHKRKCKTKTT